MRWNVFEKVAKVLAIWWGSTYISAYNEFSVKGSGLFFLVAWVAHPYTDGAPNFDFPVLFFPHTFLTYNTQSGNSRPLD